MAEHRVAVEPHGGREGLDVGGLALDRPGLWRRRLRAPGRALVDEEQPAQVAERIQIGAEHRVVEARAAVQDEERELTTAALGHVQARVTYVDEHARTLSSGGNERAA